MAALILKSRVKPDFVQIWFPPDDDDVDPRDPRDQDKMTLPPELLDAWRTRSDAEVTQLVDALLAGVIRNDEYGNAIDETVELVQPQGAHLPKDAFYTVDGLVFCVDDNDCFEAQDDEHEAFDHFGSLDELFAFAAAHGEAWNCGSYDARTALRRRFRDQNHKDRQREKTAEIRDLEEEDRIKYDQAVRVDKYEQMLDRWTRAPDIYGQNACWVRCGDSLPGGMPGIEIAVHTGTGQLGRGEITTRGLDGETRDRVHRRLAQLSVELDAAGARNHLDIVRGLVDIALEMVGFTLDEPFRAPLEAGPFEHVGLPTGDFLSHDEILVLDRGFGVVDRAPDDTLLKLRDILFETPTTTTTEQETTMPPDKNDNNRFADAAKKTGGMAWDATTDVLKMKAGRYALRLIRNLAKGLIGANYPEWLQGPNAEQIIDTFVPIIVHFGLEAYPDVIPQSEFLRESARYAFKGVQAENADKLIKMAMAFGPFLQDLVNLGKAMATGDATALMAFAALEDAAVADDAKTATKQLPDTAVAAEIAEPKKAKRSRKKAPVPVGPKLVATGD